MTQSPTDKLLPCPFCGGEATSMPVYNSWGVTCSNGCCERGGSYQEDAEEEWNTRHNPDANALKIAVEALRSIAESSYDYMTGKHSDETAEEALAEIERIAENKGG